YLHCPYDTLPQLLRLRPDVLISGELGLRTLQASFYKALNPGCQFVIWATLSEHSEQGRGVLREHLRRLLLKRADAVIVNGASGRRYVRGYGVKDERIFVSPYT